MKKFCTLFAVLLTACTAVGQTYTRTNVQFSTQDITLQTGTTNAWKYLAGNPICNPNTLAVGALDRSVWCIGGDGYPYIFNQTTKAWDRQTQMASPVTQVVVVNQGNSNIATNVYSLQHVPNQCGLFNGKLSYAVFHFNPGNNTWTQPNTAVCMTYMSADYKGNLYAVGWDSANKVTALYTSTNGGTSWSLWSDDWKYIQMQSPEQGCALDNGNNVVRVFSSGSPSTLPALPSGTAAGCLYADTPSVVMAWTTTGAVYAMPLENYGTWQAVTGLSAQSIVGDRRSLIFAEDASGKPYHWNINAATISSTWGGTWQGGCPTPSQPCNAGGITPTHTLSHQIKFRSGGSGQKTTVTQNWNTNFAIPSFDINPFCDPFYGDSNDNSCIADDSFDALCNESGHTLGTGKITLVVADSTDVEAFAGNVNVYGPMNVNISGTGGMAGYYIANVVNHIYQSCGLTGPATCPATDPADILLKGSPWLGPADEQRARLEILTAMQEHATGETAPYVYYSIYMAEQLPDGTIDRAHAQCFADASKPDQFLDGFWEVAPPCQ